MNEDPRLPVLRILAESEDRSKWEQDLLASIVEQLEAGRTLSPLQEEKLLQVQRRG